jgi:hypothetical protein
LANCSKTNQGKEAMMAGIAESRRRLVLTAGIVGSGLLLTSEGFTTAAAAFVLMYQNHAAREDTIVFPAWKEALSERQLREMGDKFEDTERQTFGKDGFEDAVKEIAQIEQTLGFADLAQFTAPPPPKA